jgi:uncharacterized protein YjbI with pentapeptide repeats
MVHSKEATMKDIKTAQLRKWVLVGLGAGVVVSALLGALPICDYGQGLALNLATELAGALVTYILLQLVIGRREEEEVKKANLIAQMGSSVKDVAIAAAEELRRHGWLGDGSLRGAELYGADLRGARLNWADLQGAFLSFANLQGADLVGANLQRVLLYEANLQGADLRRANLQEVSLTKANLQKAILAATGLQGAFLNEANLQGAFLTAADLQETDLTDANLQEASLAFAHLQGARMYGADLRGADLSKHTTLPDGTKWTPDTDMARFTDTDHPDFWWPGA